MNQASRPMGERPFGFQGALLGREVGMNETEIETDSADLLPGLKEDNERWKSRGSI